MKIPIQITGHEKIPAGRWVCLVVCRRLLATEHTTKLLMVQATGCSTTHTMKMSDTLISE